MEQSVLDSQYIYQIFMKEMSQIIPTHALSDLLNIHGIVLL